MVDIGLGRGWDQAALDPNHRGVWYHLTTTESDPGILSSIEIGRATVFWARPQPGFTYAPAEPDRV